jgi:ribosomal protein L21E
VTHFSKSGLFVREVARSHTHGEAVMYVVDSLFQHVDPHHRFVGIAKGAVYGAGYRKVILPLHQEDRNRPPSCLQSFLLKSKMAIVVSLHLFVTVVRSWRTSPI